MRYGKASWPQLWMAGLLALATICSVGAALVPGVAASTQPATARPALPPNFAHYRDAQAGFAFDYPRQLRLEDVGGADTQVLRGDALTIRVSTTALGGRSLRALAVDAIGDPTAASETRNTAGSVVMVEHDTSTARAVKAIALTGQRGAILVVEGAPEALRDAIVSSFMPVSAADAAPGETDAETRYRNPELGFSIERPQGAQVSRDGDDSVSFKVLGPDNAAASEISDGFVLTVIRDSKPDIDTVAEYAEAVRPDGAPSANDVHVGGHAALQYTTHSDMGDTVSHWLYRIGDRRQYQITATVSGDRGRYHEQIRAMLESLRFD